MQVFSRSTPAQSSEVPIARAAMQHWPRHIRAICYIPQNGQWEFWQQKREFLRWMEAVARPLQHPRWSLSAHVLKYHTVRLRLHAAARRVARTPTLQNYRHYVAAYAPYAEFIWTPWSITYSLEPWLLSELQRVLPEKWEWVYEGLAIPSQRIPMEQLERALLRWRLTRGSKTELEHLARRFGHLRSYSINDQSWTAKDLAKMAAGMPGPAKEVERRRRTDRAHRARSRAALALLSQWPGLRHVAEVIHCYTWLRTDRADEYKKAMVLAQPLYRALERRFGWQHGWAGHCTYEEICTALALGGLPEASELERRAKNQYVIFIERRKGHIISTIFSDQRQWSVFLRRHVPGRQLAEGIREVRGTTAFSGHARGRARVILRAADVASMRHGEILISDMTHPDYMTAIRKAAAMVTDEGGILCHAASISRELKIPCIIATQRGSKVLKTGDMIEVDATHGVVRKV